MHRSGTSCLTGSLQQGGLNLGEHSTWNPHNTKGNRENDEIMALHEDILAANQCSWHQPKRGLKWTSEQLQRAKNVLAKNAQCELWGFKDPRTLFALEGWLSLNINVQFVGIYRDPHAVAQSLLKRGSSVMGLSQALELWYKHNAEMLRIYKRHPFPILSFDWDEDTFHHALNELHKQFCLTPLSEEDRFYEQSLVHNQAKNARLPWKVGRLYKRLIAISRQYQ